MPAAEEQTLLARAQTSAAGFGELFDAYYDRIYRYAYRRVGSRATAEDIAASVFEDALRGIKRVRWQGKPIIAWLYRIAARRIADYYRSRHDEVPEQNHGVTDGRLDEVERSDEVSAVRRGLDKLCEGEREIIRMAFFDELSGEEIASLLSCSPNASYVRLHRALKKLKLVLCEDEVETK